MKKINCVLSSLALAMLLLWAADAPAQLEWEKVLHAPSRIAVIYFYNNDLGFVGLGQPSGDGNITPTIYRTSDGGESWTVATTPKNKGFGVNDIFMQDEKNGWAGSDNRNGRIWKTTDGGNTWIPLSSNLGDIRVTNSVRKSARGLIFSDFMGYDIELSTDGGKTLKQVYTPGNDYVLGMDFLDSLHGAAVTTFRSVNPWSYTSDGGLTWHPSNFGIECWTVRGLRGTSTFYAIPEGRSDVDDYLSDVMRSDDYGVTWKKIRTLDFRTSSDVELSGGAMYVQTSVGGCTHCSYPDGRGIYRSNDSGLTWHGLGGPEYWNDSRFAVSKTCQGTVILCADVNNNVYRILDPSTSYINTSDGPLHTRITFPDTAKITTCKISEASVRIDVDVCYKLVIDTEKMEGRDSEIFLMRKSSLPLVLSGSGDSITVTIYPVDTGSFEADLHLIGYYDYGDRGKFPFDTIIPFFAKVKAAPPRFEVDKNSIVFSISPCSRSYDATLSLINKGCDTLVVDSGPGNTAPFIFDHLDLPLVLPPSQSKTIGVRYMADSLTSDTASAIFHASTRFNEGLWQVVSLSARKEERAPKLETGSPSLDFQTLLMCEGFRKLSLQLTNPGCDTIWITSSSALGPEFILSGISFPVILPPKASVTIEVTFDPKFTGYYSDTLQLLITNAAMQSALLIPLTGEAKANTPQVALSTWGVDFQSVSTCQVQKDTIIVLRNTGCDSLTIISGPGKLPQEFIMGGILCPVILAPGDSIGCTITFQPSGAGSFSATPVFIAERYGVQTRVEINLHGEGVQGIGVLQTFPNAFAFSPANICSAPDSLEGIIDNTGCDSLVVDAITLSESPAFALSSLPVPVTLAPQTVLKYEVYSAYRIKGDYAATVTISAHSAHGDKPAYKNAIPVSASIGDGIRTCTIDRSEIDFGAENICAAPDSAVRILNTGCDTVTITSGDITGTGFLLHDISFPIVLAPGNTIRIPLLSVADTSGGKSISKAVLTLESNAAASIGPVLLQRENSYPVQHEISISNAVKNGMPGDTIELQIDADAGLQGVRSLDLDLEFNTDLLGLLSISGPNQADLAGGHLHIAGNPYIVSENGVLATITLQVFLTKAAETDIILSNAHLNESEPSFESCTATAKVTEGSTRFISSYACGEQTISKSMRGELPMKIKGVYPNPATNVLALHFDSAPMQDAVLIIYDALGNEKLRKRIVAKSGMVTADISSIASGMYEAVVETGNSRTGVSFIKKD